MRISLSYTLFGLRKSRYIVGIVIPTSVFLPLKVKLSVLNILLISKLEEKLKYE